MTCHFRNTCIKMEAFKEDLDWTISSLNASISNTSVSKIIEKASQIVLECMYIKDGLGWLHRPLLVLEFSHMCSLRPLRGRFRKDKSCFDRAERSGLRSYLICIWDRDLDSCILVGFVFCWVGWGILRICFFHTYYF